MEENRAAVIARKENNVRRRIGEALEILCQSTTHTRDRIFEPMTSSTHTLKVQLKFRESEDKHTCPHVLCAVQIVYKKGSDGRA